MKIYFAGTFPRVDAERLRELGIKNKLYSFVNEPRLAARWGQEGLLLDSGAFTEFAVGKPVDIDSLISFIKKIRPEYAVQLDVIGDDDGTWRNYQYMVGQGLTNILPVIHHRASEEHIKRVLEASDYVLLGGLVPLARRPKKLRAWLDYLYSNFDLKDKKIHALGITSRWCLERYPFYSVDSSSALSLTRYPSSDKINIMHQKTKHYTELYKIGIDPLLELEAEVTRLSASRGVVWDNLKTK